MVEIKGHRHTAGHWFIGFSYERWRYDKDTHTVLICLPYEIQIRWQTNGK